MKIKKYLQKGDKVLVWSLQSFSSGGFLKGEPAFLRQSQSGDSVIVCVTRNFKGQYLIDNSYEVYREQVKKVKSKHWDASKDLKKLRKEIIKNQAIL